MKPGTYDMVYYQGEFAVETTSVTVTAGSTTTKDITGSVKTGTTIFKIGDWNGQYVFPPHPHQYATTLPNTLLLYPIEKMLNGMNRPTGFLNADNQLRMHPSDERMAAWEALTYTVGSSELTDFPMAIFKGVNDPVTISFTATSDQTGAATLRIGTTLSFAGGRPEATVWLSPYPP